MNRLQYLLIKLAEEASEISQMALKSSHFGLEEVYNDEYNKARLQQELTDLNAIVKMLNYEFDFGYEVSDADVEIKINKVNEWYNHSVTYGHVTDEIIKKPNTTEEGYHVGGIMSYLIEE